MQDRNRPTRGYQGQAGAAFQESPLVAGQAVLAQGSPAFGTEGALVVKVLHIGLDEGERFLALPRPVSGIETTAWLAGTGGGRGVASEDVTNGGGSELDVLLGEVAGKPLASIAGLLVELQHASMSGSVFLGWRLGVLGWSFSPWSPYCW